MAVLQNDVFLPKSRGGRLLISWLKLFLTLHLYLELLPSQPVASREGMGVRGRGVQKALLSTGSGEGPLLSLAASQPKRQREF